MTQKIYKQVYQYSITIGERNFTLQKNISYQQASVNAGLKSESTIRKYLLSKRLRHDVKVDKGIFGQRITHFITSLSELSQNELRKIRTNLYTEYNTNDSVFLESIDYVRANYKTYVIRHDSVLRRPRPIDEFVVNQVINIAMSTPYKSGTPYYALNIEILYEYINEETKERGFEIFKKWFPFEHLKKRGKYTDIIRKLFLSTLKAFDKFKRIGMISDTNIKRIGLKSFRFYHKIVYGGGARVKFNPPKDDEFLKESIYCPYTDNNNCLFKVIKESKKIDLVYDKVNEIYGDRIEECDENIRLMRQEVNINKDEVKETVMKIKLDEIIKKVKESTKTIVPKIITDEEVKFVNNFDKFKPIRKFKTKQSKGLINEYNNQSDLFTKRLERDLMQNIQYLNEIGNKFYGFKSFPFNLSLNVDMTKNMSFTMKWKELRNSYKLRHDQKSYMNLTGYISNLTVIDIDINKTTKENCSKRFFELLQKIFNGKFKTRIISSRSGGYHIYFRYNNSLKNTTDAFYLNENGKNVLHDVDIRNKGGCIVAPGTYMYNEIIHKFQMYNDDIDNEFYSSEIADFPEELLEYALPNKFVDYEATKIVSKISDGEVKYEIKKLEQINFDYPNCEILKEIIKLIRFDNKNNFKVNFQVMRNCGFILWTIGNKFPGLAHLMKVFYIDILVHSNHPNKGNPSIKSGSYLTEKWWDAIRLDRIEVPLKTLFYYARKCDSFKYYDLITLYYPKKYYDITKLCKEVKEKRKVMKLYNKKADEFLSLMNIKSIKVLNLRRKLQKMRRAKEIDTLKKSLGIEQDEDKKQKFMEMITKIERSTTVSMRCLVYPEEIGKLLTTEKIRIYKIIDGKLSRYKEINPNIEGKFIKILFEKNHYSLIKSGVRQINTHLDKIGKLQEEKLRKSTMFIKLSENKQIEFLNKNKMGLEQYFKNVTDNEHALELIARQGIFYNKKLERPLTKPLNIYPPSKIYTFDFETFNNTDTNNIHTVYNAGLTEFKDVYRYSNIAKKRVPRNESVCLRRTKVFFGEDSLDKFIDEMIRLNELAKQKYIEDLTKDNRKDRDKEKKKFMIKIEQDDDELEKEMNDRIDEINSYEDIMIENIENKFKRIKVINRKIKERNRIRRVKINKVINMNRYTAIERIDQKYNVKLEERIEKDLRLFNEGKKSPANKYIRLFVGFYNSKYDNFPLIGHDRVKVTKIMKNNGILTFRAFEFLRFVDQYRHTIGSLSSLCEDYEIPKEYVKTIFPHKLANELGWKLLNFKCRTKDLKVRYFNSKEDRKKFISIYKENVFDFKEVSIDYQKRDCISLMILRKKYREQILDITGIDINGYLTSPSVANSCSRHALFEENNKDNKNTSEHIYINQNIAIDKFIRSGIYGGYTNVIKRLFTSREYEQFNQIKLLLNKKPNSKIAKRKLMKFYNDVKHFQRYVDFTSLYPSAMSKFYYPIGRLKVINSKPIYSDDISKEEAIKISKKSAIRLKTMMKIMNSGKASDFLAIMEVNMKYVRPKDKKNNTMISTLVDREYSLIDSNKKVLKGDKKNRYNLFAKKKVIYSNVRIEDAVKVGWIVTKIHRMVIWRKKKQIFNKIITKLFNMRDIAKKEGKSVKSAVYKLIMNSIYGKLIQRIFNSVEKITSDNNEIDDLILSGKLKTIEFRDKTEDVFISYDRQIMPHDLKTLPHLGVFILDYSKRMLYDAIHSFDGFYNEKLTPDYFDTDSMQVMTEVYDILEKKGMIGKKLGDHQNCIF
ncbi:MAG: DNA polymerase [Candidatus Helarchaeota archaeon]